MLVVIRLKMALTDATSEPSATVASRRKLLRIAAIGSVLVFATVLAYQHRNRTAPSVGLDGAVAITWEHLRTERWGYTLHHETRVAYLGFWPHGGVGATMGTRTGDMEVAAGIGYKWRIETPKRLIFTDQDGVKVYFTFDLIELAEDTALVADVSTGELLSFTRRYYGQDNG